ncbi:MAG TPA: glycosyltransferase family 2 protein [Spongiibacteraceae bacterium]|nr:glycosyltransferase family 2 protein [Spongiibacteraceae bacterium]
MVNVSVIIPFFQRKSGLLTQAIESICRQNFAGSITVLVANDASPIDPASEIPANLPATVRVQILNQKNAGPGAARNLGLQHVTDSQYVAFLDSDDQWTPNHLRNAIDALDDNADLYFSNHCEPDSAIDAFSERRLLDLSQHRHTEKGSNCYEYIGDMRDQIIRANIIETSTVVYRWRLLDKARFNPTYRNAFEDHLFWMDLVREARSIVFSTDVECNYGRGVSIWRSGGLGSANSFPKIIDQLRFINTLSRADNTTATQLESLRNIKNGVRRAFASEMLHRIKRLSGLNWHHIAAIIKLDPLLLLYFFPISLQIATKRQAA